MFSLRGKGNGGAKRDASPSKNGRRRGPSPEPTLGRTRAFTRRSATQRQRSSSRRMDYKKNSREEWNIRESTSANHRRKTTPHCARDRSRKGPIATNSFLECEAEETSAEASSSRRYVRKRNSVLTSEDRRTLKERRSLRDSKESGASVQAELNSRKRQRRDHSYSLSTDSHKGRITNRQSAPEKRHASSVESRKSKMKRHSNTSGESKETGTARPKRRASLEAYSAMVAMKLQMERPLGRRDKTPSRSTSRLRSSVKDKQEAGTRKLTPTKTVTSRKKRRIQSPTILKYGTDEKTKPEDHPIINHKDDVAMVQSTMHPFVSSMGCIWHSPPPCPVHSQLQCTCHHHGAPVQPLITAAQAISVVGGVPPATAASAISAVFPFPTVVTTSATATSSYCLQYQHGDGASPLWTLPSAHSLASWPAPEGAGELRGFPAVFQGHLFIRPHHHDIPLQNQTVFSPLASASIFASSSPVMGNTCALHSQTPCTLHSSDTLHSTGTLHCSDTLHSQLAPFTEPLDPFPSASVAESGGKWRGDSEVTDRIEESKQKSEMVQRKSTADAANREPVLLKSTKNNKNVKGNSTNQKRPKSNGEQSKRKRRGRRSKCDLDESSTSSNSSWEPVGRATRKWVYVNNDAKPIRRECFEAIRHITESEVIRTRDCVIVKSSDAQSSQSNGKTEECEQAYKKSYIAKVAEFFRSPNGSLWASIAWYYWPEQAEFLSLEDQLVFASAHPKELLASRHVDCISVDSIEDLAYVVTINEYNRYISENKAESSLIASSSSDDTSPRAWTAYPRRRLMPADDTDDGLVYFIRRVYDFHGKRLLRNPSF